jgi:hypothetical protein
MDLFRHLQYRTILLKMPWVIAYVKSPIIVPVPDFLRCSGESLKAAQKATMNPELSQRTKHFETKVCWVRSFVAGGDQAFIHPLQASDGTGVKAEFYVLGLTYSVFVSRTFYATN